MDISSIYILSMFYIISSDNKKFNVERHIVGKSATLKELLFEQSTQDNHNTIIIKKINSQTLSHVLTFIKYNASVENSDEFNNTFVNNMNMDTLFDVIIASDYLKINKLFDLCVNRFRNIIGLEPEEIRKLWDKPRIII